MNDIFRGMLELKAEHMLASVGEGTPFFFASPEETMLAEGHFATVPASTNLQELTALVEAELQKAVEAGHPDPVVVGAIPFDASQPASLIIPEKVLRAGPLSRYVEVPGLSAKTEVEAACDVRPVPAPQVYAAGVQEAVQRIRKGELSKVVLARTLELEAAHPIDLQGLLRKLAQSNSRGYTFAVSINDRQGALVGASPELLLSRHGNQIRSNPLAGSAARTRDLQENMRRSQALLLSEKDLHEHKMVADAVVQALTPYCRSLYAPAGPSLVNTETMLHLASDIRGELADPSVSSLQLASSMHPTPAVCGYPFAAAREMIAEIEPFERGLYAGMVGWCDAYGNGEWVVTLRCAEVNGSQVRLFAGAGVVADSYPAHELAETGAKFRTMLNALGIASVGEA